MGLINTSIPQTFINNVIDNELAKDDLNKRVSLKYQAFIGGIIHERFV